MPCWVKVFLVCYKSQKVFGAYASFDETVCWWVNAIRNGQEDTDYAPRSVAQILEMDNTTWNKWDLSLDLCTVFLSQHLLQKLEPLQQVFTISSPTTWGNEKFVQSGFHVCSTMTKESCVFYLPPICCIGRMEAMHSWITF
jgi:hypothetical protein